MTRTQLITATLSELRVESQHYLATRRGEQFLRDAMNKVVAALDTPLEEESEMERGRR